MWAHLTQTELFSHISEEFGQHQCKFASLSFSLLLKVQWNPYVTSEEY